MTDADTMPADARALVVVSHRLPIALSLGKDGAIELRETVGGLATALTGARERHAFTWVGWAGQPPAGADHGAVEASLRAAGYEPVSVPAAQHDAFYNGMCNSVIWPLFHYFLGRISTEAGLLPAYAAVNQAFADVVIRTAPEGAHVWIHDYHLMMVPAMLRAARPDLRISFFLHVPFPSSEIYRILPWRAELLAGVLGADYLGFHTGDYARHFRSSCLRVLGLESGFDYVVHDGRRVGVGVHPIGADVTRLSAALHTSGTLERITSLRTQWRGRRVILGVERLDYSKAIPLKLMAYEEFLRRDPRRAAENVLVQVVVPSRLDTEDYRDLKDEIEQQVGRINGLYGTPGVTPIEYLHRQFDTDELAPLYRAADVGIVTPARDGMNLVAHEFVLCQSEPIDDGAPAGVLLLSEFAGAAHSLSHVLLTNPWSPSGVADALEVACAMPAEERSDRMARMRERVIDMDAQRWAARFLAAVDTVVSERGHYDDVALLGPSQQAELLEQAARASRRVLLLDYDGTLRELTRRPLDARPSDELRTLLTELSRLPDTEVHIVSGRDRRTLATWLGDLPISICAEHGFAWRPAGQGQWSIREDIDLRWLARAEAILRGVEVEVDDSEVERKPCGVTWHYRRVDPDYGEWRARELRLHLGEQFANEPVEILAGRKVVELRAAGVDKGHYVRSLDLRDAFVLAIGDDRTDVDMYSALPPGSTSVHVGVTGELNLYRVESPADVRGLLARLRDRLR
ncbi:MAG: bifunctional alpha,alpha-trehalose-phosphate synthase (UDP-forming)/trehalose-phosphatase [Deltaproteobacteria bacterium]|nr:bifunctional alpha,alpha-trehalose-phosphate synthase (UDP-forming)/trehalose-phosphatase [Deltaproteobacteria bacterium]